MIAAYPNVVFWMYAGAYICFGGMIVIILASILFGCLFACKWSPNRKTQSFWRRFKGGLTLLWVLTGQSTYDRIWKNSVKRLLYPYFGYGCTIVSIKWINKQFKVVGASIKKQYKVVHTCTFDSELANKINPSQLWSFIDQKKQPTMYARYIAIEYKILYSKNASYWAWYDQTARNVFPPLEFDRYWSPKIPMSRNQSIARLILNHPTIPKKTVILTDDKSLAMFNSTRGPELLLSSKITDPHIWPVELLACQMGLSFIPLFTLDFPANETQHMWSTSLEPVPIRPVSVTDSDDCLAVA